MKKMKKILAMFLAMAMVLGMSMTTFAAKGDAGTITVEGAGEAATYQIAQIIKEDTSAKTGWAFVNDDMANAFLNVFFKDSVATEEKAKAEQAQKIIYRLLKKESATVKEPKWDDTTETSEPLPAADAADIQTALKAIMTSKTITFTTFTNGSTVTSAGLYAIKVGEAGYAYSPITAYIAPGATLGHAEPVAKRVRLGGDEGDGQLTKEHKAGSDSAAIGEAVEYTITATIPYVPEGSTGVEFKIKDEITGAKYVTVNPDADASDTNKPVLDSVKIGETDVSDKVEIESVSTTSFTVNLEGILEDNQYVNDTIVIKYRAKVVADLVKNTATAEYGTLFNYVYPNDPDDPPTPPSDEDVIYTGSVTMTKKGEADALLGGAEFKVYFTGTIAENGTISSEGNTTYYAILDANNKVTGWTETEADASNTTPTSSEEGASKGTVKVSGLKFGVAYMFKEVKAPANYSINTTDEATTWNASVTEDTWKTLSTAEENDNYYAKILVGTSSMTDTVLASLPSTGGIGTTIFTVGGCAIMIIAAGLYFASRRRAAK